MTSAGRLLVAALLASAPVLALNAQDAPESLLPPGFDRPAPAPSPSPSPEQGTPAPRPTTTSSPVVQPLPSTRSRPPSTGGQPSGELTDRGAAARAILERLPNLDALDEMDTDEIDELLGLKPAYDIPPQARRSTERVGLLGAGERGMASDSLENWSGEFVRKVLAGTRGPLVSRWGHILMRRALVSRLAAPQGMDGVEFAALRTALLTRLGEATAARALAQEVDTGDYSPALIAAAYDAYLGTGDFTGACPMARLHGSLREDANWNLLRAICSAYVGESSGMARIDRALRRGDAPRIDALLAQKYAGAIGRSRRAVTIEWDEVEEITPFRYSLATATGAAVPENLVRAGGRPIAMIAATAPAIGLVERAQAAEMAAAAGVLSSAALVDLYSQIYADQNISGAEAMRASRLREAYVGAPDAGLAALRDIWGEGADAGGRHARQVLTAYAAARMRPGDDYADDAGPLIASMLTAGLDRNALLWADHVEQGSLGWALLALSSPSRSASFNEGAVRGFLDNESSDRAGFLVAGLAGLGRIGESTRNELSRDYRLGLDRETRWTRAIIRAAGRGNQPLTVFLAALGMQGSGWDKMTPLHLYHIVSALQEVGLEAEARMIAAEAVARA